MNRRRADAVVGVLVGAVLVIGVGLTWDVSQQQRAMNGMMGSMMDSPMASAHGTNPLWYGLGTLLVASVVTGLYAVVRDDLAEPRVPAEPETSGGPSDSDETAARPTVNDSIDPEVDPRTRVLDLLPEDERRVLEPVLTSPGITQIALRDRSEFSKSKVSQTVSALEKRGLLYRERQGRTYRVYPSDELEQDQS